MTQHSPASGHFDPRLAASALAGLTETLCREVAKLQAGEKLTPEARVHLAGLAYAAREIARELNEYFRAAKEAGLELPDIVDGKAVARAKPRSVN